MDFKVFLPLFILLLGNLSLFINNGVVEASHQIFPEYETSLRSDNNNKVKQLHRTAFHFQPAMNWINDPNGPMYYKGLYHFFYQYNPKGASWGNHIVWGHSVSKDMVNWESLEPAISPSAPYDINGAWSGSATILPGSKPVILYTGRDLHNKQVQNYAIPANSSDPYLRKWIKPANNPIVTPGHEINATAFRDPTTAWFSNRHWKMAVGGKRNRRGMAILYRSKDFVNWVKSKHPLHSGSGTGMWECPDFYPVLLSGKTGLDTSFSGENVKHVFKVSLDETRFDYYNVGTYFPGKDSYVPDSTSIDGLGGLRYDYGNFYASKTFFDPSMNRRLLWGWANESDSHIDDVLKGWAGIQAIPRIVWLDKTRKQVLQWPIQELESLRGKSVKMRNKKLEFGQHVEVRGITAAQADVEVVFSFNGLERAEVFDPSWVDAQELCGEKGSKVEGGVGPFGILALASRNLEEFTPVFFRIFKGQNKHVVLMCSDARSSSLKEGLYKPSFAGFVDIDLTKSKKISLRTLIDHSVVESFGAGGKTCILSRVYPTLAIYENAHLYAFNNGTETITVETLTAWSMSRPLKMNN